MLAKLTASQTYKDLTFANPWNTLPDNCVSSLFDNCLKKKKIESQFIQIVAEKLNLAC